MRTFLVEVAQGGADVLFERHFGEGIWGDGGEEDGSGLGGDGGGDGGLAIGALDLAAPAFMVDCRHGGIDGLQFGEQIERESLVYLECHVVNLSANNGTAVRATTAIFSRILTTQFLPKNWIPRIRSDGVRERLVTLEVASSAVQAASA